MIKRLEQEKLEEELVRKGELSYLSALLINRLLRDKEASEKEYCVILFLVKASQEGHLCLEFNPDCFPDFYSLWSEELLASETWEDEELYHSFRDLENITWNIEEIREFFKENSELIFFHNKVYLKPQWLLEKEVANEINKRIKSSRTSKSIEIKEGSKTLNRNQALAVERVQGSHFFVLTGGPGTGKTYTATEMIKVLAEGEGVPSYKVAVVAPTGKAAVHLYHSLNKYFSSKQNVEIEAFTLHRLLGLKGSLSRPKFHKSYPLPYHLVLVDESSMIDCRLWRFLLPALAEKTRLILIGDPKQLPPVESGGYFSDLTDFLKGSDLIVELEESKRAKQGALIEFAARVNHGEVLGALELMDQQDSPVSWGGDPEKTLKSISAIQSHLFLNLFKSWSLIKQNQLSRAFKELHRSMILCSFRKGALGVKKLNEVIYSKWKAQEEGFWVPLVVLSNDDQLGLFNGQLGLAFFNADSFYRGSFQQWMIQNSSEVYFEAGEGYKSYSFALLPTVEFAWALSIHKAQGSEFESVELVVPEGAESFGRQVLYTGITRAKSRVSIYSDRTTLEQLIQSENKKLSGLLTLLKQEK